MNIAFQKRENIQTTELISYPDKLRISLVSFGKRASVCATYFTLF